MGKGFNKKIRLSSISIFVLIQLIQISLYVVLMIESNTFTDFSLKMYFSHNNIFLQLTV